PRTWQRLAHSYRRSFERAARARASSLRFHPAPRRLVSNRGTSQPVRLDRGRQSFRPGSGSSLCVTNRLSRDGSSLTPPPPNEGTLENPCVASRNLSDAQWRETYHQRDC